MLYLLVPSDLPPSTAHPTPPPGGPSRRPRSEHNQGNVEEPVKSASPTFPAAAARRSAVNLAGAVGRRVRPPALRPHRVEDRLELPAPDLENRRDRFPLRHDVVQ